MSRSLKIGLSLLGGVIGWLMIGVGYATPFGHPTGTALFSLGILIFIASVIAAILWGRRK